jgi:hypothetical protein
MDVTSDISASIFNLAVADVFRAQGANPDLICARRPALAGMTQEAISLGLQKIQPVGWVKQLAVLSVQHNRMILEGNHSLTGDLILDHLAGSKSVAFVIASLGQEIDRQISESMRADAALGFALDTVGSLLAETLADYFESKIRAEAADHNQSVSLQLSPGLVGWPVNEGQPQIFNVLQPDRNLIQLTTSAQMIPRKSISFVMGIGCPESNGTICDFCDLKERCPNRRISEGPSL